MLSVNTDRTLHELAQDIAEHLGRDWFYRAPVENEGLHHARIQGPGDKEISLSFDRGYVHDKAEIARLRVTARGLLPYLPSASNGGSSPCIGCAFSRGAAAISKDIVRRLLPEYGPALKLRLESNEAHLAYQAALKAEVDRITALMPAGTNNYREGDGMCTVYSHGPNPNVRVRVSKEDSKWEIYHVPPAMCAELAALIRKYQDAK